MDKNIPQHLSMHQPEITVRNCHIMLVEIITTYRIQTWHNKQELCFQEWNKVNMGFFTIPMQGYEKCKGISACLELKPPKKVLLIKTCANRTASEEKEQVWLLEKLSICKF